LIKWFGFGRFQRANSTGVTPNTSSAARNVSALKALRCFESGGTFLQ